MRKNKPWTATLAVAGLVAALLATAPASAAIADDCGAGITTYTVDDWAVTSCQRDDLSFAVTATQTWDLSGFQGHTRISQGCDAFRVPNARLNNTTYPPNLDLDGGVEVQRSSTMVAFSTDTLWVPDNDPSSRWNGRNVADGVLNFSMANWSASSESLTLTLHCDTRESVWQPQPQE